MATYVLITVLPASFRPSGRKKGLKMASLNVNGLLSKIDEVRLLAKNEKIDIFVINET